MPRGEGKGKVHTRHEDTWEGGGGEGIALVLK
jgi:hypothetical protein